MTFHAPTRLARYALSGAFAIIALLAVPSGQALAHNSLVSSDPTDGAIFESAPTQITWNFENPVPLDTMTVTFTDATGVRTDVEGSVHGTTGDREVVTPLPTIEGGEVSVRWRLVGADGHPITGQVTFTVGSAAPVTEPEANTATSVSTSPIEETILDEISPDSTQADSASTQFSTPSPVRWVLRYGSYLAMLAVVGILATGALVWPGAVTHPALRTILSRSLIVTTALALVQLLVVASDITGSAPWSSFGSIDAATTTNAGLAFLVRAMVAPVLWLVIFRHQSLDGDVYRFGALFAGIVLLATWAFAGHSASSRWSEIGVVADVAHFAAAAVWIGGLAIVGWIVIPRAEPGVIVPAVRNFSRIAATSVAVLVVTGLIQGWRLVGDPTKLLDANHGRLVALKVLALGAMLLLANVNRRRVNGHLEDVGSIERHVGPLRRSVLVEFGIGLVIIAITAALVVSTPAIRETAALIRP